MVCREWQFKISAARNKQRRNTQTLTSNVVGEVLYWYSWYCLIIFLLLLLFTLNTNGFRFWILLKKVVFTVVSYCLSAATVVATKLWFRSTCSCMFTQISINNADYIIAFYYAHHSNLSCYVFMSVTRRASVQATWKHNVNHCHANLAFNI